MENKNLYKIIYGNSSSNEYEEIVKTVSTVLDASKQFLNPDGSYLQDGKQYMPIIIFEQSDIHCCELSSDEHSVVAEQNSFKNLITDLKSIKIDDPNEEVKETDEEQTETLEKSDNSECEREKNGDKKKKSKLSLKFRTVNVVWRSYMTFTFVFLLFALMTLPYFFYTISRPIGNL